MEAAQRQNRKDAETELGLCEGAGVSVVGIIMWDRDVKKTGRGGRKTALGDLDGEANTWMCCWVAKTGIIDTRNLVKGFFMQQRSLL